MKLKKLLKQLDYCMQVDIQPDDDSHPMWRMFRYKGMLGEMPYDTYDLLCDEEISVPVHVSGGALYIELAIPENTQRSLKRKK